MKHLLDNFYCFIARIAENQLPGSRVTRVLAIILFCLPFLFLVFSSCVLEDDVDLKVKGDERIVVISTISPGDSIIVTFDRTSVINQLPVSSVNFDGLIVSLWSADGDTIVLAFDSNKGNRYFGLQSAFPIEPGQRYFLEVITQGKERLTASCQVPLRATKWENLEYSTVYEGGIDQYSVKGSWIQDTALEGGYAVGISYYGVDRFGNPYNFAFNALDFEITRFESVFFFERLLPAQNTGYSTFSLISMEEHLNAYYLSSIPYLEFIRLERNDIINSFKGVYPHYTNIVGGVGIFGAYVRDVRRLDI